MIFLELFWGFFKVSCFTFGGGFGAIALIRDLVLEMQWLDEEMLAYMIAVGESTPGPIMVNLATYVGSAKAGFAGAVIATFAVVLPAYLIILLVSSLLKNIIKNVYVQAVLQGLKPCVTGIVLATGTYMVIRNCLILEEELSVSIPAILVGTALVVIKVVYQKMKKKKISPILLIVISACLGILFYEL